MPKKTLRKKKDIDQVFTAGLSFYCPILGVKALKNDLNYNRLAIIIGLKVSKLAVVRNKIKRQVRAVVKEDFVSKDNSYDIVVIIMKDIVDKSFIEIRESLLKMLSKLR